MSPSKAPIEWANIAAAILSVLSLLVAMDIISLTGEQFDAITQTIGAVGVALWPIIAGLWARQQTTPLAMPRDVDGAALTRPDNTPAIKEMAAIQQEIGGL